MDRRPNLLYYGSSSGKWQASSHCPACQTRKLQQWLVDLLFASKQSPQLREVHVLNSMTLRRRLRDVWDIACWKPTSPCLSLSKWHSSDRLVSTRPRTRISSRWPVCTMWYVWWSTSADPSCCLIIRADAWCSTSIPRVAQCSVDHLSTRVCPESGAAASRTQREIWHLCPHLHADRAANTQRSTFGALCVYS